MCVRRSSSAHSSPWRSRAERRALPISSTLRRSPVEARTHDAWDRRVPHGERLSGALSRLGPDVLVLLARRGSALERVLHLRLLRGADLVEAAHGPVVRGVLEKLRVVPRLA